MNYETKKDCPDCKIESILKNIKHHFPAYGSHPMDFNLEDFENFGRMLNLIGERFEEFIDGKTFRDGTERGLDLDRSKKRSEIDEINESIRSIRNDIAYLEKLIEPKIKADAEKKELERLADIGRKYEAAKELGL